MRVLHLDSGADWRGGQQQVLYLAEGLKSFPVEQHLIVRAGSSLSKRLQPLGLPVIALPFHSEWGPLSLFGLLGVIRKTRPQVIHAHDSRTLGMAVLLKAAGCYFHLVASRRVAFPLNANPLWRLKYQKFPDRIIAVSRHIRELLVQQGIAPGKVQVIHDGLLLPVTPGPEERRSARRHFGLADGELLIGTAGQFTREKGHEVLIRAFRAMADQQPGIRLLLLGDGPLRSRLSDLARSLGLQDKVLLQRADCDLGKVFPALDLFVYPSLVEGLGSVLLLAMAYRIPVCASRTGGIPELVVQGETGFLVPPGEPSSLAEQVLKILRKPDGLKEMVERAYQRVNSEFNAARMVSQTFNVYTNLLGT